MIPRSGETLAFLDELGAWRTVQIRHACMETRLVIVLPDMQEATEPLIQRTYELGQFVPSSTDFECHEHALGCVAGQAHDSRKAYRKRVHTRSGLSNLRIKGSLFMLTKHQGPRQRYVWVINELEQRGLGRLDTAPQVFKVE